MDMAEAPRAEHAVQAARMSELCQASILFFILKRGNMVPSLIFILQFHDLGLDGQEITRSLVPPSPKPCRYTVKLIYILLPLHHLQVKSLSSLLPPELVPEISSFLSRMTFICSSAAFTIRVLTLRWRQTLSCINLHVAAWWLRHVCPRSPLTSSSTPGSRAGGHI